MPHANETYRAKWAQRFKRQTDSISRQLKSMDLFLTKDELTDLKEAEVEARLE